MKRGNKKGQFYLIAAIIIIAAILGFAAVSNIVTKRSSVKVYDLREELEIESGEVLEYGVTSQQNLEEVVNDFILKYEDYAGENRDLYFIYGDFNEVIIFTFRDIQVKTSIGNIETTTTVLKENITRLNIEEGTKEVVATINNIDYSFELKPGQNFFFVISEEVEGEQHIVTS
jgi:hypothetical protein